MTNLASGELRDFFKNLGTQGLEPGSKFVAEESGSQASTSIQKGLGADWVSLRA